MSNHPENDDISPALAIGLSLMAFFLFTAGDALGKWLQAGYGAAQILVTINLVALAVMAVMAIWTRGIKKAFHSTRWKLLFLRGLLMGGSTMLVFIAIKHLPLPDFYGIIFLTPIWVALISRVFLKEHIPPSRIVAIVIGFLGVAVIAGARFSTFNIGVVATLASSVMGAVAALLARKIGKDEVPTNFGLATHSAMTVLNLPLALSEPVISPTATDAGWMLLYGIMLAVAMMAISNVFARSHSVSQVAPLQYTQMLWGILLGWMVFDQAPTLNVLAGALLVIASGIYVMRSLRRGRLMTR